MKNLFERLSKFLFSPHATMVAGLVAVAFWGASAAAAAPATRIHAEISTSEMTALPGSKVFFAQPGNDTGRLSPGTRIEGMSIYFSRTPAQEAALQALIAAQQNPSSPSYHQWLTPEQFAARFGMADADLAKVEGWLERQGFSVDSVARGKTMLRFSGTAAQVEAAFATEMHSYSLKTQTGVETHFAPATAPSVPTALAGVVQAVRNLDDFRPRPRFVPRKSARPKPRFTGYDSSLFFAPGDIAVQYDVQSEYNSGYIGTGQSIAVIGQSEIELSDIEAFQSASGLPVKDPDLILVPNSGAASYSQGDWAESDIDLEWSGAVAKGATVTLVYVGGDANYSAFDSLVYAIDNKVANIVSSSYGECEAELAGGTLGNGAALQTTLEAAFEQAAAQGQSILSAAGDDGSTDCYEDETGAGAPPLSTQQSLAVDYPASSAYVTAVGGTEISQANSAYETPGEGYWENTNGSTDIVTSVEQYIPEQAWNEDTICAGYVNEGGFPLCAGGGGASTLFSKPSWQTGVAGIPADGHRDVPDIALNAAVYNPGYLYCTSDQSAWDTTDGQQASCNDGFRDEASGILTAAGGTSFATPIFGGMLAIVNQQKGYTSGQGLVNPTLYQLASDSTTYAAGFHDIASGDNDCDAGSPYCNGSSGFSAGTGYDQATGLGTIDLYGLANAWPANTGPVLIATTTTVTASNTAPLVNTADTFTISVTSQSGATPTGTVNITVDSGTAVTETLTANGTYTYQVSFTTAGTHTVVAVYSGDTTHAGSTGSATITAAGTSSGTGSFTMKATNVTVAQGAEGTSTITVTPAGGYTGTVDLAVPTLPSALDNLCGGFVGALSNGDGSVAITGTAAGTAQLNLDTNAADCATADARHRTGMQPLRSLFKVRKAGNAPPAGGDSRTAAAELAFAGLLLAGLLGRGSKKLRTLAGVVVLAALGFGISACGGNNSNTISDPPAGSYTITVDGQDATSSTIPSTSTSFTLTIQ